MEQNTISAASFGKHVLETHLCVGDDIIIIPPDHTLIVEAGIKSSMSKKAKQKIDNVLRDIILTTCGDAHVKVGKSKKSVQHCAYISVHTSSLSLTTNI